MTQISTKQMNKEEDAFLFLESLVSDRNRVKTVASARNRTIYKKKKRRKSPESTPMQELEGVNKAKTDGFFCLLGNN